MASTAPSTLLDQLAPQPEKKEPELEPDCVKVGAKRLRDEEEAEANRALDESGSAKLLKPEPEPEPKPYCVEVGIQRVLEAVKKSLDKSGFKRLSKIAKKVRDAIDGDDDDDVQYDDEEEMGEIAYELFGNSSDMGYNVARALLGQLKTSRRSVLLPRTNAFCKAKPKAKKFVKAVVAAHMLEEGERYCEKMAHAASQAEEHWADEYAEMSRVEYYERNLEMLCEALDCGGWRTFLDALRQEDYAEAFAAYQDLGEYEYIPSVA